MDVAKIAALVVPPLILLVVPAIVITQVPHTWDAWVFYGVIRLKVTTVASEGSPAEVLCRSASEQEADVLVVGSKGMNRRWLASVPNTVAHKAPCSVLIVKTA